MVFLFLIICFLFPNSVSAESSVKISDFSSSSSPEWVQINNNSSSSINISGWYFKDLAGTIKPITDICISANTTQIFEFTNYLNNEGDTLYLYNNSNELIDTLTYTSGVTKDKPIGTNTCNIPTNTPTATPTPTNTPTPTATPTSDPTVTNPSSGISVTEFMPYSDPEWVEIRNTNNNPVKLVGWKLEDKDGHTRNISDITIGANSYYIFEYSAFFDNNNNETVIFRRQDNTVINQTSYSGGLRTVDRSWSFINNNWCQSSITKGYENVSSCYSAPTATVTPSNTLTPTPDQSKFTSADTATESAIIEPSEGSSFITPNTTTPVPTNGEVLGQDITNATKKNYLPLILIIFGGLLLTSPVIISKLKK